MHSDSLGNKFSQAKKFNINQADPKEKKCTREVEWGCKNLHYFYSTSAYHSVNASGHWLTGTAKGFGFFIKSSAFC